jgi:hypothetical protein
MESDTRTQGEGKVRGMQCPNCASDIAAGAIVPDSQRFAIHLTSEMDMFSAATIGGVISNTDELLKAIAEQAGYKVEVFVESLELKPREITVELVILRVVGAEANTDA